MINDRERSIAAEGRPRRPERPQRPLNRTWIAAALASGGAALVVLLAPESARETALRLAIVALGIVAAWLVLGRSAAVTATSPERFGSELVEPVTIPSEIAGLRDVETNLRLATASSFGLEVRLKPMLRDLARWRLERNRGVDIDTAPDAARRILGEPLWNLMQASDDVPGSGAPGVPLSEVRVALDRLEQV